MAIETKVEATLMTLTDIARQKMELTDAERERMAFWQSLDPERRAVVLGAVQLHLLRLLKDPERWVPGAVEARASEANQLHVRIALPLEPISMGDTGRVDQLVAEAIITRAEVIDELARTIREIRGEQ